MNDSEAKDMHPREDDRNEEIEDSPVPDPESDEQSAEDVPDAD
jgi:hypothetical protein